MDKVRVITQVDFYGKILNVYGFDKEDAYNNPKFLGKEVADIIEYAYIDKIKGIRNVSMMLKGVNDKDKCKYLLEICDIKKVDTTSRARDTQEMWFITENGLYKLLARSRNKIAEQWLDEVSKVLKEYRMEYNDFIFTKKREESAKEHDDLHKIVGDEGKCIGLDIAMYKMCSYLLNLEYIQKKEAIYQLKKSNIVLYDDIMNTAKNNIIAFRMLDSEHYMSNVIKSLENRFIDDKNKYEDYCKTHKKKETKLIVQRGFGRVFGERK